MQLEDKGSNECCWCKKTSKTRIFSRNNTRMNNTESVLQNASLSYFNDDTWPIVPGLFKCVLVLRTFNFHCKLIDSFVSQTKLMWGTKLLRWETTDLKTRSVTKQRKRRRESRTQSGKKRLCASPLCKKNCNRTQTSAIQFKPNRELSPPPPHPNHHHHPYQPPSLPQLIFHFSSRAYRMRDVSISRQSFPGLCVTCVVISVWLTGSVVSHCPAASDSHRLTLLMMSRKAPRPGVFLQEQKSKKTKLIEKRGWLRGEKKDTSHAFNEKHARTNTYNGGLQKKDSMFNNITRRQQSHAVLIQKWVYLFFFTCIVFLMYMLHVFNVCWLYETHALGPLFDLISLALLKGALN